MTVRLINASLQQGGEFDVQVFHNRAYRPWEGSLVAGKRKVCFEPMVRNDGLNVTSEGGKPLFLNLSTP